MKNKPTVTKVGRWIAEDLNKYAAMIVSGQKVPGHTPSSPLFWFCGLARETEPVWKHADCAALLSQDSRTILIHDLHIEVV